MAVVAAPARPAARGWGHRGRHRRADPRRDAVPAVLDAQRLAAAQRLGRRDPVDPARSRLRRLRHRGARAGRTWRTSLVVAVGSVVFSLLVATPAAYALAQFRVRGAGVVLFGILISQMIPGIVVANALYSAYSDLGLLNSIPGLILADSTHGIPFAILIMRAYLLSSRPR